MKCSSQPEMQTGGIQLGKTFGDYLREQGGKEPEKVIPTDECVLDAIKNAVARNKEIDSLVQKLIDRGEAITAENVNNLHGLSPKEAVMNQLIEQQLLYEEDSVILGEEAEYALCETCQVSVPVDSGVMCEGCHEFLADHGKGRNNCWKNHNCGKLVTSVGRVVKEGDTLVYPSHADEFTVLYTEGTWVRGGHARGKRKRGAHEMPIIPRLMYHKEAS